MEITAGSIQQTYEDLKKYIHRTPVLTSSQLNSMAGTELFFKCENFQKMGAFKMRGATNAILNLSEEKRAKGVVTHSSGNFAQALSLAAKSLGVPAYIVMPENAPEVKKRAVNGYGGKITECPPVIQERERFAEKIHKETGATFVHPSNDLDVIMGNATAAYELLEDYPDLEVIVSPVGGGGLIAGTALAIKHFGKKCICIGAEPEAANDAYRSLKAGEILDNDSVDTIADGLKTNLGDINFPIIKEYVSEIITVSEKEIKTAMRLVWERMKIVIEPSSAVSLAAVLKTPENFRNKKTGIIISGGNVDLGKISKLFT